MKKLLVLSLVCISFITNAQTIFNQPFGHKELYGERGECLFPMDDDEFAILTGVVECDMNTAQILDAINAWYGRMCFNYKLDVNNNEKFVSSRQIIFKAEMPIGHKLLFDGGTPSTLTGMPLDWDVSESDLSFVCKIDVKDKKFRYTFSQIVSDRWRLRGEAESEGPINDIYWQRVNCLNNTLNKTNNAKKRQELQAMINYEEAVYYKEYRQMKRLEEELVKCVQDDSENEEFVF